MDEASKGRNLYFKGCFGEEDAEAVAQRLALVKERDALRFALQGLHDDVADYQRINHLGGYDNHWMKIARDALAQEFAQ
jgi:hypothetical protein